MKPPVIDAGIAVQWVVEEDGTDLALALRQQARLIAPDLLVPECAEIRQGKRSSCGFLKRFFDASKIVVDVPGDFLLS